MLALVVLAALASSPDADRANGTTPPAPQRVVDQGIAVEFAVSPSVPDAPIAFTFGISDTASGAPISGARPAAWLARRDESRVKAPAAKDCTRQVATFLGGDLFGRPEVDLNAYFVLALNDDASISIVDPLFGFGGSKLLAMLQLESAGEDWALTPDQRILFVSMPAAGKVAVADTLRWQIVRSIETGPNPRRIVMGERLWVADDEGVTSIDPRSFVATRVRVGPVGGVAISSDGELAFAATGDAVIILDAHDARVLGRVPVGGKPSVLAYSSAGRTLYAADRATGHVVAIDPRTRKVTATIALHPGLTQMRFAPNGRHALIANPERNIVQVLDAALNRVVQNAEIGDAPFEVTFTPLLAYVRRRDNETVLMIPLEQIGIEGKPIGVADFPGGQHGYGEGSSGSLADSIVAGPEGPSVLVANPADKMIYLYKEGMAAPAGGFSNYGRQPRAVLVVDRGLRESRTGRYETTVPVEPGAYDVVFFLDAPRVVACFAMTVAPLRNEPEKPRTRITAIAPPRHLIAGQPVQLRFSIGDPNESRATDIRALAFEAPGVWQQRRDVTALPDGTYAFAFTPPEAGMYYVWLESESLGLAHNNSQFLVFEAR